MKIFSKYIFRRVSLTVGLIAIIYFFLKEFNFSSLRNIHLTERMILGILFAFILIVLRDILVAYRFKLFSDN